MKKLASIAVVVAVIVGAVHVLSIEYRHELYDFATKTGNEMNDISVKSGSYQGAYYEYLESPKKEDQETLLLIHGFGANKNHWFLYSLPMLEDYHVVALDLLGHGKSSDSPDNNYRLQTHVDFVIAAMNDIGIESAHLVGNSMGGAISAAVASLHPERVKSATLISPAGVPDHSAEFDEILEKGRNMLLAGTVEEYLELSDFAVSQRPWLPEALVLAEADRVIARRDNTKKMFADLNAERERGIKHLLSAITVPVYVMWGAEDRILDAKNLDIYADLIPNSKRELLKGVGHLAMVEVPDWSAELTDAFIKALN